MPHKPLLLVHIPGTRMILQCAIEFYEWVVTWLDYLEERTQNCDNVVRKRTRLLCFLFLIATFGTYTIYNSNPLSWSTNHWWTRSWSTKPLNNGIKVNRTSRDASSSTKPYFVAYPHQYHFMLDEPEKCQQEKAFLVIVIPVAAWNRRARDAIRKTWGGETVVLGKVVSRFFLLGRVHVDNGSTLPQEELRRESQEHHDLLQADFLDSYYNLTLKTMVMLEWLTARCPGASYAMKTDSDMFVNVHNLVNMLLTAPKHAYMTGRVVRYGAVLREPTSKWFLPEEVFSESHYPPYAMGLGYVFSMDLSQKLIGASRHVEAICIEDVYLGLCLRYLGINLTDPPDYNLFSTWLPFASTRCHWAHVITTILENSEQLLDAWRDFQSMQSC